MALGRTGRQRRFASSSKLRGHHDWFEQQAAHLDKGERQAYFVELHTRIEGRDEGRPEVE